MKLELDPPSGYAGSYLDVKFTVSFDKCERAELSLYNKTFSQPLTILSANGRILNGTNLIVEKTDTATGYINIFNNDKMNDRMEKQPLIEISCSIETIDGEDKKQDEISVEFYNESMSLDRDVPPFDLQIKNTEIDLSQGEPLTLTVTSNKEQKYEIAIKSLLGTEMYMFDIIAKQGECTFSVPCEVLSHHLELKPSYQQKFVVNFVKYEGLTPTGHMNRKIIPFSNIELSFKGSVKPKPQKRNAPDGSPLNDDFILSDRYFVHTYKEFTSLGRQPENIQSITNAPRLLHEVYAIRQQSLKQDLLDNQKILKKESYKKPVNPFVKVKSITNKPFASQSMRKISPSQRTAITTSVKKSGGCGCSRSKT